VRRQERVLIPKALPVHGQRDQSKPTYPPLGSFAFTWAKSVLREPGQTHVRDSRGEPTLKRGSSCTSPPLAEWTGKGRGRERLTEAGIGPDLQEPAHA